LSSRCRYLYSQVIDQCCFICRVGRTSRYKSKGNSLLLLLESEQGFAKLLEEKTIQVRKIQSNPTKTLRITGTLQSLVSQSPELLHLAKKAIICYLKSINLMPNKDIFTVEAIKLKELAESYGLFAIPKLSFKTKGETETKNEEFLTKKRNFSELNPPPTNTENKEESKTTKKSKLQKLREKIRLKKLTKSETEAEDLKASNTESPNPNPDSTKKTEELKEANKSSSDNAITKHKRKKLNESLVNKSNSHIFY
jgi:ATP-dependent RNA helicase DDX10/DBP4